ncbi:hypothetical protein VTG60DRAFT_3871 [Thermothelomyces hinnuleus]
MLAGAYQENGQVKEAVALLEQVVAIHNQALAQDHPSRLASQHTLAGAYQANGQVKEAVTLLEQVVAIQAQVLAEDHPDQLASQHELAADETGQVARDAAVVEFEMVDDGGLWGRHPSTHTMNTNPAISQDA